MTLRRIMRCKCFIDRNPFKNHSCFLQTEIQHSPFYNDIEEKLVTGSSGSNHEHVDYEMLLFILAYKLGFMSTTSGLRN
jgi:hypothetical protein